MGAVVIPPWVKPEREPRQWLDEMSVPFRPEFGPGLTQRQNYGDLRLKISRMHTVRQHEQGLLMSALLDSQGQANAVYAIPSKVNRGSMCETELLANNSFDGTSSWSSSGAELVVSDGGRVLRATRTAVSTSETVRAAAVTVVNGASYAARVFIREGRGSLNYRIRLGTSAGGSEIAADSSNRTAQTLATLVGTASGTTMHFSIFDDVVLHSAGDFFEIVYASLARCALVNGASQTGYGLIVDGLPASSSGLLMPGDFFVLNGELKMATAMLNSDSGGNGYMRFKPAIFRSPANNDPVVLSHPVGRFLMTNLKGDPRFGTDEEVQYDLEQFDE